MKEITDTSGQTLTPEGTYRLKVFGRPEKRRTTNGKSTYRIWRFKTTVSGTPVVISILMFPQDSHDLLLAVGGKEVSPYKIEWDDEFVDGKVIIADIVHEPDKSGKLREKLRNVRPEMELSKPSQQTSSDNFFSQPKVESTEPPDIAWEE